MLAADRPRKTAVKWAMQIAVTSELPDDLIRPMLDQYAQIQLAKMNKRGPRWQIGETRYDRLAVEGEWERGYDTARLVVRFVAVPA